MITSPVLVDTGPMVAVLCKNDQHHLTSAKQFDRLSSPLLTCWPVLTEAAWMLRHQPDKMTALLNACNGNPYEILMLTARDIPGIRHILQKYSDQGIQLADACLMYLADREHINTVFTTDQKHFSLFRTIDKQKLQILQ